MTHPLGVALCLPSFREVVQTMIAKQAGKACRDSLVSERWLSSEVCPENGVLRENGSSLMTQTGYENTI